MFVTIQLKKSIPGRQEFRGAGGLQPSCRVPGGVKRVGLWGGLGGCKPPLNFWIPLLALGKVILTLSARGTPKAGVPKRGRDVPRHLQSTPQANAG